MDCDRAANEKEDETRAVQDLQQKLFPPVPLPSTTSAPGGYFMNIIVKPNQLEDENSEHYLTKKESKELFAVVRDPSATIQAARWPTECQVLDEKIRHVNFTPAVPEPYYVPTGKEVQPKPVGEELGIIIYQYYPISAVNYFSRSSVGGSRFLLPTCPSPEEDSLRFESRFEGGNLAKAIKITATYYELYLRTDLYTNKHMQWFYFRVYNMKKNINYRFSIVNMTKDGSLFNEGMKPLLYSTKDAQLHHIGWRRCADNITYFCNETAETEDPDQVTTYTLTFTLEFPHESDFAYLAYSYPYTYTDLQDYLLELAKHPIKSTYTTLRLLCRTLAGNNLYYVTITAPPEPDDDTKKKAVIITGRVHPGEAPASWMMKGILDFLTGDTSPAKELREKFLFKIVPMLNPDGVIVGNSRCCLSGRDLNRQYRTVIRESYPAIWYTKLLIRRSGMVEECGVAMYVDLHAHSRKHNIFIYGCENRRVVEKRLYEQVFPLMLHKNTADKFSFEGCKFRVNRCKEGTGRVVMWMMGIGNSYTMEASFGGSLIGTRAETHFSTLDYEQMGRSFCQTLLDFYDSDPRKERLRTKIIERLHQEGSNADEPTNIPLSDFSSDEGDTSSSSDEGGRHIFDTRIVVPPPSPVLYRKIKPKTERSKGKTNLKNAVTLAESRKIYHICKTTLDLSLPHIKTKYSSDSSSDAESLSLNVKKKVVRKRRAKKRSKKRQFLKISDSDNHEKSPRSLSVMDLAPLTKFRSHSWHRQIAPPKPLVDTRNSKNTTQQLAEVQAKLISLKNRLWLGSGEGDASIPLSWGQSKLSENKHKSKKSTRKQSKSESKNDKPETKNEKRGKNKEECKEKPVKKKSQKKQPQWIPPDEFIKIDNMSRSEKKRIDDEAKKNENSQEKKTKKKKKPPKLQKKATLISNMTVFIGRD